LFVGYGRVAARFVRLLEESRAALAALDVDPVIDGIATRRLGRWSSKSGEPLAHALGRADRHDRLGPAGEPIERWIAAHAPGRGEAGVLVETTTLDVSTGEPAIGHVRAGLASGRHVITANKGPVAFAYRTLAAEAATRGLLFLFEGAVMDGIPVFSLVRETCPALTIRGFRGVVNSTTNAILSALERGEPFGATLRRMQDLGIAEADASLDLDGWDAAAKTAALANVWLGAGLTPHEVAREGISAATAAPARAARTAGRRLKLIASAGRDTGGAVRAEVSLRELAADDPLAHLDDQANAIEIDTWPLGRITIGQRDGGLEKTAYALLADLVTVRRSLDRPRIRRDVTASAPLTGVTILDLSRVLAGPYCTMLAADMGARVIKIEHPAKGDDTRAWGPPFAGGESAYYLSVNRNKESVAIDFRTPEGRATIEALIARADVVVENFRPGALDRIGLGYETLAARHPDLIYVAISGYGRTGPRHDEPGYDAVAQAESGLMSITGESTGPAVRLGVAIADLTAGMYAFQGLLLALLARGRTGRGQLVDVALLDAAASLLTYQASRLFMTGESPGRSGNRHQTIAPYDTFDAAGGVLVLAVGNDDQWRRLCPVLGLDALAHDPRYATNDHRVTSYESLRPQLEAAIAARPLASLVADLRAARVPCGSVRSVEDALADPQIIARDMIATLDHPALGPLRTLGIPMKLSGTPGAVRTPPPRLGEHTRAILCGELGVSEADLDGWIQRGAARE
jgi:formyl-CoA transferase/CoA:oxalate CoA-transferase